MKKVYCAVLAALALTSIPAAAQVMDAEEHRRPAQEPHDPDALLKELRLLGFEGAVVSSRDSDVF